MQPTCPDCGSDLVKKNGHTRHGKQNHRCLTCDKQFVVDPEDHKVDERTKNLIRKTLLERVSLQGICRIFEISMPWLLGFIESIITQLPEDLNAEVLQENDDIEVIVLEADELWSFVGSKDNPQWLWLVMHSRTRQVVAMQVGSRDKQTAERLFAKLPEPLKKKPSTILTSSLCTMKQFPGVNINPLERNLVKHVILKD